MREREQQMKRISIIAACITAMTALGAMVTATAQAAPEFGQCVKLGKYTVPQEKHGKFEDPACLSYYHKVKHGEAVYMQKGRYEWREGAPLSCEKLAKAAGRYADASCTTEHKSKKGGTDKKGEYEKVGSFDNGPGFNAEGLTSTLGVPTEAIVTKCDKYHANGAITGTTTGTVTAHFEGCEIEGTKETCHSVSPLEPAKSITTKPLHTAAEEVIALYPGSTYTPEGGPYLAEYECGGKTVGRVSGFLAARYLPESEIIDKMGHVLEEEAAPGEIEQDLEEEFSFSGAPFKAKAKGTESYKAKITFASEVELRLERPEPPPEPEV